MSVDPGAQEIVINEDVDNVLLSTALREQLQDPLLGEGTITVIIRSLHQYTIREMNDYDDDYDDDEGKRLQDPSLGEGTINLIIRDPNITIIGDTNSWGLRSDAPFIECKSLLHVDLKGCTKLTQLGDAVFWECSSLIILLAVLSQGTLCGRRLRPAPSRRPSALLPSMPFIR